MAKLVESVVKAYRILDTFSASNSPSSIRQIAAKTGLPRSTVYDLCQTLIETGQLEYTPGIGYQLGVRLVAMAGPVLEKIGLVEAGEPALKRLATLPSGAVFLSLLTYPWVTYIAFTHTRSKLNVQRNMGLRVPLHTSGSGIAILSGLNDQTVKEYLDGLSDVVIARVTSQIETFQRDGYLVSDSFQKGIRSVSTVILGNVETPIGTLVFLDHTRNLNESNSSKIGQLLIEEARLISIGIRHRSED